MRPYGCSYTGPQLDVQGMIDLMKSDKSFGRFIRRQLRTAFDQSLTQDQRDVAVDCLRRYFLPAADELIDLQLPAAETFTCTEHGRLIQSVAYGYS